MASGAQTVRVYFLGNPDKESVGPVLEELLSFAGSRCHVVGSQLGLDGQPAVDAGADRVVVLGGDGTLNEITNGFFSGETKKIINDEASLGIIPSGTGSDFIRFMRIPRDFKKSVELIKNSKRKKIDIGKITYPRPGAEPEQRYFINVENY